MFFIYVFPSGTMGNRRNKGYFLKYFLYFIGIIYIFIGCATHLNITNKSSVDPDYNFNTNRTILILTYKDDIDSKYYKSIVAKELRIRGFKNVYTNINTNNRVDNVVLIKISNKINTYQYTSADYGMVNDGTSSTSCYGLGYGVSCDTTSGKRFGVTGYSAKTGYSHLHFLYIDWYDNSNKQKILLSSTHTDKKNCNSDKLYKFLIKETIKRMDFNKPNSYSGSIEMPENYSCE